MLVVGFLFSFFFFPMEIIRKWGPLFLFFYYFLCLMKWDNISIFSVESVPSPVTVTVNFLFLFFLFEKLHNIHDGNYKKNIFLGFFD